MADYTRPIGVHQDFSRKASGRWIGPCTAALIPVVITPGFLFFYDVTPKVVLLCLGTAGALPFVQPRTLLAKQAGRWFCGILGAAFLSLLLSTAFSVRAELSIFGTNWRRFGLVTQTAVLLFAFVVAADLCGRAERLRAYLRASSAATILVAVYGVLQYLGWDPLLDPKAYHVGSGEWTIVRPPGTLGYVTYFANYLVFGVFQGVLLYGVEEVRGTWRWAGLAAAGLGTIAIIVSGTRAAWIALAVGGLVYLVLQGRRPSARSIWMLAGLTAGLALFYASPAGLPLRSRMRWVREDATGGARLYLWRDSLSLLARHPVAGSGAETFSLEFPNVQSRDLSRAFPEFYHESAHNVFLDVATAQGLPGLLILAAAAGLGFWAGFRQRSLTVAAPLIAAFTAILVCHQFSVFTMPTTLAFWITLGMLVALGPGQERETERRMLWMIPVSVVLVIGAVRMTVADHHLARVPGLLAAGKFEEAQAEYTAAGQLGLHSDLWYCRKLLSANQLTPRTLAAGISATATAEDPYNAWMNLAMIYAQLSDVQHTEWCIRAAVSASPNWYKSHAALAQLLLATNRRDEGEKEARLARELNTTLPR